MSCTPLDSPTVLDKILATADVQMVCVEEPPVPPPQPAQPVIVVHAGAEDTPADQRSADLEAVKAAALDAYASLVRQMRAIDVAEMTMRRMESYYQKECGKMGLEIEMDAAILDETSFKPGCVGAVQRYRHPITLARHVAGKSDLAIVVGEGAEMLAEEINREDELLSEVDDVENGSEMMGVELKEPVSGEGNGKEKLGADNRERSTEFKLKTFGTTILDSEHRLSCATVVFRTGEFGRLSATGVAPGCGIAGDSRGCVSISGDDASLYVHAPARAVFRHLDEHSGSLGCAFTTTMQALTERTGKQSFGGTTVDDKGTPSVFYNSESFPWAYCAYEKMFYGCARDEVRVDDVVVPTIECSCTPVADRVGIL